MTMTLKELAAVHAPLFDRLDSLREPQRIAIAEAAMAEGIDQALIVLETQIGPLERALRLAGYEVCTGQCAAWFPELELEEGRCEDCTLTADFVRRPEPAPDVPEVTEPTEPTGEPVAESTH